MAILRSDPNVCFKLSVVIAYCLNSYHLKSFELVQLNKKQKL